VDAAQAFCALASEIAGQPGRARQLGTAARQTAERMVWSEIYAEFEQALFDVIYASERNAHATAPELRSRPA